MRRSGLSGVALAVCRGADPLDYHLSKCCVGQEILRWSHCGWLHVELDEGVADDGAIEFPKKCVASPMDMFAASPSGVSKEVFPSRTLTMIVS